LLASLVVVNFKVSFFTVFEYVGMKGICSIFVVAMMLVLILAIAQLIHNGHDMQIPQVSKNDLPFLLAQNNSWIAVNARSSLSITEYFKQVSKCVGSNPSLLQKFYVHKVGFAYIKDHFPLMNNRHIYFIGDSTMFHQFQVCACMLGNISVYQDIFQNPRFNNISVHVSHNNYSAQLSYMQIGMVFNGKEVVEKYSSVLAQALASLSPQDVIIVNQGVHHNFDSVDKPAAVTLRALARTTVSLYASSARRRMKLCQSQHHNLLDSLCELQGIGSLCKGLRLMKDCERVVPTLIWRETTPQFYHTCNGWYSASGFNDVCVAISDDMAHGNDQHEDSTPSCLPANSRNEITNPIVFGGMRRFPSKFLFSGIYDDLVHASTNMLRVTHQDCTHMSVSANVFMNAKIIELLLRQLEYQQIQK
jgi:hypothetical protein